LGRAIRGIAMSDFVYRANVDHYLELLHDPNLTTQKRATVVKLLITQRSALKTRT